MASVQKVIVFPTTALTAASTTGDGLSIPSTSSKPIGYLVVTAPHASTTVAAKIQHSPNGQDGWTDYITFTTTSAGATANEVMLPASSYQTHQGILPHVRALITLGGATTEATVAVDLMVDNRG